MGPGVYVYVQDIVCLSVFEAVKTNFLQRTIKPNYLIKVRPQYLLFYYF